MVNESRAQFYRRKAAESRQAAEKIGANIALRDEYLRAERAWLDLAAQTERSDELVQRQQQQQQQQGNEGDDKE